MADPINVAYLNESSLITDAEIAPFIAAYQEDIGQNGAPWALGPVVLRQIPKGDPAPSGWRQQVWLDNTDQGTSLGYHDLTIEGLGIGKIFVGTTQRDGQTPSRVGSHEIWEMLVDERLNRYTDQMPDGRQYAVEVGDLTSLDSQGRQGLGGVLLSDIALPATYWPNGGYPLRYSIGGALTAPLPNVVPTNGAYLMWKGGAGWAGGAGAAPAPFSFQAPPVTDPADFMHFQPQFGSRRHRRIIGEANWWRSTVPVR
jgi:hypothetical protein